MAIKDDYFVILGVHNFANYESSAAAILVPKNGGEILYRAIGEDRLTRRKHTYTFPLRGIDCCFRALGPSGSLKGDVPVVVENVKSSSFAWSR